MFHSKWLHITLINCSHHPIMSFQLIFPQNGTPFGAKWKREKFKLLLSFITYQALVTQSDLSFIKQLLYFTPWTRHVTRVSNEHVTCLSFTSGRYTCCAPTDLFHSKSILCGRTIFSWCLHIAQYIAIYCAILNRSLHRHCAPHTHTIRCAFFKLQGAT